MDRAVRSFRKIINPPYKPADLIILFVTLFILITIPLIVIETTNPQNLRAKAGEDASVSCPLTIGDKVEPTVYFENPLEGDHLTASTLLIKVAAKDNICVQKVFLLIDGVRVKTFTAAPYVYSWNLRRVEPGNHTISAQVVDSSSNFSMAAVSVFRGVKGILLP